MGIVTNSSEQRANPNEAGAAMVEYLMCATVILAVAFMSTVILGRHISGRFDQLKNRLASEEVNDEKKNAPTQSLGPGRGLIGQVPVWK